MAAYLSEYQLSTQKMSTRSIDTVVSYLTRVKVVNDMAI